MKQASDIVAKARQLDRLTTREWIDALCTQFIECKGDRHFGDDGAIVGGVALFNGRPVTVIGTQKGKDLESNLACRFGSPMPEGYRKANRLMQQANKFNRPIITFVNTAGANCSLEAETRGIGEAIAQNLIVMSQLTVPILTIIIGEGGSGGALGLAMGNKVYMMEHSMYAILSPEGFASILWKDAKRAKEAAQMMKITPDELKDMLIVDDVFEETIAQTTKALPITTIIQNVRTQLEKDLMHFDTLTPEAIVLQRQQRFRQF